MTLGMTSCNIDKYFWVRRLSHHLPGLPDGAAQEHAKDHPEHLQDRGRPLLPVRGQLKLKFVRALLHTRTIITAMVMATPPMMCSLESNTSSMASGQL